MRNWPQWEIAIGDSPKDGYNVRVVRDVLFRRWLSQLEPDKRYALRIEPWDRPKSNEQLGWYHGCTLKECLSVINQPLLASGKPPLTERELDAFFSKEFLTVGRDTEFEGVLSKGGLTTKQFTVFMEHVALYMIENYGYTISEPDKNWKLKKKKGK